MPTANTSVTVVPAARFEGLITTASDDEIVVYDQAAKHIHHLNEVSSVIWRLCDGQRGVSEIAIAATDELGVEVSEEAVRLALRKLDDAKLLVGPLSADIHGAAQSRRNFMKKAAIGGAAVPVLASITAPHAAATGSTDADGCRSDQWGYQKGGKTADGGPCSGHGNCCSHFCNDVDQCA